MIHCPTHGESIGDHCLSCYRDYASKVWPIHARYHATRRPNDPESFHHNERWGELAAMTPPSDPGSISPRSVTLDNVRSPKHTDLTSVEGTQANQT